MTATERTTIVALTPWEATFVAGALDLTTDEAAMYDIPAGSIQVARDIAARIRGAVPAGTTCTHCGVFIPEPTTPMPHDDRPSPWEQYASDVDQHKAGNCEAGRQVWPGAPYVAAPNGGRS